MFQYHLSVSVSKAVLGVVNDWPLPPYLQQLPAFASGCSKRKAEDLFVDSLLILETQTGKILGVLLTDVADLK